MFTSLLAWTLIKFSEILQAIAMKFNLLEKKFVKSNSFSYHPKVTFPSQVVEEEGDGGSSSSSSSVAVLSVPVVVLLAWNEN